MQGEQGIIETRDRPLRLLVVCPSWVGDAVMATPTLRLVRDMMPGILIGGLCRPGIEQVLDGLDVLDQVHVERPQGILGPKRIGFRVRAHRYDTALLLTNSFSSALITRVAGIPRRIGFDRDGRSMLLTDRLTPPKRADGSWAIVPAVNYYYTLGLALLEVSGLDARDRHVPRERLLAEALISPSEMRSAVPDVVRLELACTDADRAEAGRILRSVGADETRLVVLNPGGNKEAKRWPAERFSQLADVLSERGFSVVLNGSPGEIDLLAQISAEAACRPAVLAEQGMTLKSLKAVIERSALLVTNDTGPRHFAAALGTPCVTLFGPTDPRWTALPVDEGIVVADPTLPNAESANDHPERCAVDRITLERVVEEIDRVLRS